MMSVNEDWDFMKTCYDFLANHNPHSHKHEELSLKNDAGKGRGGGGGATNYAKTMQFCSHSFASIYNDIFACHLAMWRRC